MFSTTGMIIMLAGLVIGQFMFSWLYNRHHERFPPSMKGHVHAWLAINGACVATTSMFGNFAILYGEMLAGRPDTVQLAWEGNYAAGSIGLSMMMFLLVMAARPSHLRTNIIKMAREPWAFLTTAVLLGAGAFFSYLSYNPSDPNWVRDLQVLCMAVGPSIPFLFGKAFVRVAYWTDYK